MSYKLLDERQVNEEAMRNERDLETVKRIGEVLERYGRQVIEDAAVEDVVQQWIDAGFDDAEEVDDWIRAGCFSASGARVLEAAGITPEQAAIRTSAGSADYEDTIGYKLTHGDLSADEARRIITNEFWNS